MKIKSAVASGATLRAPMSELLAASAQLAGMLLAIFLDAGCSGSSHGPSNPKTSSYYALQQKGYPNLWSEFRFQNRERILKLRSGTNSVPLDTLGLETDETNLLA